MLERICSLLVGAAMFLYGVEITWVITPITIARAEYCVFFFGISIAFVLMFMGAKIISWEIKRWLHKKQ